MAAAILSAAAISAARVVEDASMTSTEGGFVEAKHDTVPAPADASRSHGTLLRRLFRTRQCWIGITICATIFSGLSTNKSSV